MCHSEVMSARTVAKHLPRKRRAKQRRTDLILANCHAESALSNFKVDQEDHFLTHRPVGVELTVQALRKKTRALVKPDNFSILIEERVDKEIQRATDDAKHQDQRNGSDTTTKVDQGKIRKAIIVQLHLQMDSAIEDRSNRIETSQLQKDTDRQWDLIAAAVEDAIINDFNLEGAQATRMRGRSKVAYRDEDREILRGIGHQEDKQESDSIQTLNKLAGIHATQGNRLQNIHLRMKSAQARNHNNTNDTKQHIQNTLNAYYEQAIQSLNSERSFITTGQKRFSISTNNRSTTYTRRSPPSLTNSTTSQPTTLCTHHS